MNEIAPPFPLDVHEVNVQEEIVSVREEEEVEDEEEDEEEEVEEECGGERVNEIAPPFCDEHDLNVAPERVTSDGMEVNSNTPPFPLSRLIELNVFAPERVSESIDTSMSGALYVVVSAVDVNVIPLNLSIPDVTSINEHPLLI